jgi:hypothetical protein
VSSDEKTSHSFIVLDLAYLWTGTAILSHSTVPYPLQSVLRIRIWYPVPFWALDPKPIFWEFNGNFLVKITKILCQRAQLFAVGTGTGTCSKIKLLKIFFYKNKDRPQFFSPPLLFLLLDPGSRMDKNQDPGSGDKRPGSATLPAIYIYVCVCVCM